MSREEFEEMEMEEIAFAISHGFFSGMTCAGSSWNLDVNFDYNNKEVEDEL